MLCPSSALCSGRLASFTITYCQPLKNVAPANSVCIAALVAGSASAATFSLGGRNIALRQVGRWANTGISFCQFR